MNTLRRGTRIGEQNLRSHGDGEEYVARVIVVHSRGCR